ncbi:MAG: glycosyltransferase family 4 protein [Planctomycetota bacterium]
MHVAMVTVFPQDRNCIDGGVAGAARYLVDELGKRADVKLTVISHSGETACGQWGNIDVYRVAKKGLWSFLPGTLYDIVAGKRHLKSLLRQVNPNIVHFQGVTFLAADCEKPNVLTIHGIAERDAMWESRFCTLRWPRWLLLKLTEEYGRRRVPNIILISEYVRKFLPKKSRIQKTWLIDNPVADSYFDIERSLEPGRIFCCCRIRPLKNIVGMVKAFALIVEQFPGSQLRIAGAPEAVYLKACEREVIANRLQDKVRFLGNISIREVQLELSRANCLVVPSFQENAPLTIAEAMAAGVPVVAANVGGIPGMVEDGKTGLLIDPHDTRNICEAVSKILADEALDRSMGSRAREVAQKRFKASVVCERTLQVYREVLKQPL